MKPFKDLRIQQGKHNHLLQRLDVMLQATNTVKGDLFVHGHGTNVCKAGPNPGPVLDGPGVHVIRDKVDREALHPGPVHTAGLAALEPGLI